LAHEELSEADWAQVLRLMRVVHRLAGAEAPDVRAAVARLAAHRRAHGRKGAPGQRCAPSCAGERAWLLSLAAAAEALGRGDAPEPVKETMTETGALKLYRSGTNPPRGGECVALIGPFILIRSKTAPYQGCSPTPPSK